MDRAAWSTKQSRFQQYRDRAVMFQLLLSCFEDNLIMPSVIPQPNVIQTCFQEVDKIERKTSQMYFYEHCMQKVEKL